MNDISKAEHIVYLALQYDKLLTSNRDQYEKELITYTCQLHDSNIPKPTKVDITKDAEVLLQRIQATLDIKVEPVDHNLKEEYTKFQKQLLDSQHKVHSSVLDL